MVNGCMVKRYSVYSTSNWQKRAIYTSKAVQHVLYDKMLFNQTSCHTQGPGPAANLPI